MVKRSKGYAWKKATELLMYERGKLDKKPSLPKSKALRGAVQSKFNQLKKDMYQKGFGDVLPSDKVKRRKVKSLIKRKLDRKLRYVVEYEILWYYGQEDIEKEWSETQYFSGSAVQDLPEVLINCIVEIKEQLYALYNENEDISESPSLGIDTSKEVYREYYLTSDLIIHYEEEVNENFYLKNSTLEWNKLLRMVRRKYRTMWDDIKIRTSRYYWYG